jgi:hypothetical protein
MTGPDVTEAERALRRAADALSADPVVWPDVLAAAEELRRTATAAVCGRADTQPGPAAARSDEDAAERISLSDYHRLIDEGIIGTVELINGIIYNGRYPLGLSASATAHAARLGISLGSR